MHILYGLGPQDKIIPNVGGRHGFIARMTFPGAVVAPDDKNLLAGPDRRDDLLNGSLNGGVHAGSPWIVGLKDYWLFRLSYDYWEYLDLFRRRRLDDIHFFQSADVHKSFE